MPLQVPTAQWHRGLRGASDDVGGLRAGHDVGHPQRAGGPWAERLPSPVLQSTNLTRVIQPFVSYELFDTNGFFGCVCSEQLH